MLAKRTHPLTSRKSSNRVLASAVRIAAAMEMRESDVKRRMLTVLVVLGLSILGCLGSCLALALGLPGSEPARLFAVFVLLGSAGLTLLAALGLGVISWSAYVRQRILTEEARCDALEATEQMEEMRESLDVLTQKLEAESCERQIVTELTSRSVTQRSEIVGETLKFCKGLIEDLEKQLFGPGFVVFGNSAVPRQETGEIQKESQKSFEIKDFTDHP